MLGAARSARYDAMAALCLIASLALLDAWMRRSHRATGVLLGTVSGIAVLTHFLGVLAPATVVIAWLIRGRERPRAGALAWVACAFLLVLAPYVLYFARLAPDALAQFALVHGARADASFGGPVALLRNLVTEPRRYAHVPGMVGAGGPVFLLAIPLLAWSLVRSWRSRVPESRLIAAFFVAAAALLGVFEPTKAPIYAFPVLAPLCIGLATMVERQLSRSPRARWLVLPVLVALGAEAAAAYAIDARVVRRLPRYETVAGTVASALDVTGNVAGPMRWLWALHPRGYEPMPALALRWQARSAARPDLSFADMWDEAEVRYVLRTPELDADITRMPGPVRAFLHEVLGRCASPVLSIEDRPYGPLVLLAIDPTCTAALAP